MRSMIKALHLRKFLSLARCKIKLCLRQVESLQVAYLEPGVLEKALLVVLLIDIVRKPFPSLEMSVLGQLLFVYSPICLLPLGTVSLGDLKVFNSDSGCLYASRRMLHSIFLQILLTCIRTRITASKES